MIMVEDEEGEPAASRATVFALPGGGRATEFRHLVEIGAPDLWREGIDGSGRLVAVLDSQFHFDHTSLAGAIAGGADLEDGDQRPEAPASGRFVHGTAVAATIAGRGGDLDVFGSAPGAELFVIGAGTDGFGFGDIADSLDRALDAGADVLNMSIGATVPFSFFDVFPRFVEPGYEAAAEARMLVVKAAGNDADVVWSTSDIENNVPGTIVVGALDLDGAPLGFSSYGTATLVAAPGQVVTATAVDRNGDLADEVFGTSFSTPLVAGVTALMTQAAGERLDPFDVQHILAISAEPVRPRHSVLGVVNDAGVYDLGGLHFDLQAGAGEVDAHAAVRLAESWRLIEGETPRFEETFTVRRGLDRIDDGLLRVRIPVESDLIVENVVLGVRIDGRHPETVDVELTSPGGTTSPLFWYVPAPPGRGGPTNLTEFTDLSGEMIERRSVWHWGERADGTWTVLLQDAAGFGPSRLEEVELTLVGRAPSEDDTWFFTDRFDAGGAVLDDRSGTDWINAAAVTVGVELDLGARSGRIDGATFRLSQATLIENVHGGDGRDQLIGNGADNLLLGARGDDRLIGRSGDDELAGSGGDDLLSGGRGDDLLRGGGGGDSLRGGGDRDLLIGAAAGDALHGGGGDDRLDGGRGPDQLSGARGADLLEGGGGRDELLGGGGADLLIGGPGADRLSGGKGPDVFAYDQLKDAGDLILDFAPGIDRLDLDRLLDGLGGAGPDPFDLQVRDDRTLVQVAAGGADPVRLATLLDVVEPSLDVLLGAAPPVA